MSIKNLYGTHDDQLTFYLESVEPAIPPINWKIMVR